jgi:hypothetical protein
MILEHLVVGRLTKANNVNQVIIRGCTLMVSEKSGKNQL